MIAIRSSQRGGAETNNVVRGANISTASRTEKSLSHPIAYFYPSLLSTQCSLLLFSASSVLNSEKPNTEATENHGEPQSGEHLGIGSARTCGPKSLTQRKNENEDGSSSRCAPGAVFLCGTDVCAPWYRRLRHGEILDSQRCRDKL